MGCHTWTYTKIEKPSKEMMIKELKEKFLSSKVFFENLTHSPEFSEYSHQEKKECFDEISTLENYLNIDFKNYEEVELDEIYDNYCCEKMVMHNGNIYAPTEFHDMFRVSDYPEHVLLSLEDTIKYLETQKCYNVNVNLIDNFWCKYPQGLINFG